MQKHIGPSVVQKINNLFFFRFGFHNALSRADMVDLWLEAVKAQGAKHAKQLTAETREAAYQNVVWLVFESQTPPESYHEAGRRAMEV